jgi:class 3 adenylate cyclase/tetratricopeptide (TPR) repeat protein
MTGIREWLEGLGLGEYAAAFDDNAIDERVLPHLTDQDLKDIGISLVGHRRLILASLPDAPRPENAGATEPALPREAERRQITVMFCDLVGSTALSERLDPEDLRTLMQAYQQACGAVIERYEGHVAQYLGDGLMTYFGWPTAHEDDAERAVRAGLEIREAVKKVEAPEPLRVRVGIATGPVVVGETGAGDASVPKLAVGETPNLAARVQGLAGPDEIVIAPSTHRLVGGAFEVDDLGAHALKGIVEPVRAWRVTGLGHAEGRFEAAHVGGLTPLVGREAEIAMLMERWSRAKDGEGQVVLLCGEPGIGKSRITQVLRERVADEPHIRLRYQCSPYYTNSALHPIIDQFERAAGFAREDTPEAKLDKIEALLGRALDDVSQAAPLFAAMLSLPLDRYPPLNLSPQKQKENTLQALADQVEALSQKQPVLMIFEDAHWIDPTTQEALDLIVPGAASARALVILAYRPEYEPPWTGHGHVTPLTLTRLGRRQAAAMVEKVTGGKPLPDEVLDRIVAKTDGVPLFVEELTKTVLESGLVEEANGKYQLTGPLTELAIPSTLRDSLMARLDRLAAVKEVAQVGACIGREFSHQLLAAVSPLPDDELQDALGQLTNSEIVFRMGTPPEATYTFRHALVQDAAYESLLKGKRQNLHANIARTLERDFASTVEMEPETVAYHFAKGGVWLEAARHYRAAAGKAARAHAIREALTLNDQALEAAGHLNEGQVAENLMAIHQARSDLYFTIGDFERSRGENARMLEISRRVGDRVGEGTALAGLAWATLWAEDFDSALAFAREAIDVAETVDAPPVLASAHMTSGFIHAVSGRLEPARHELDKTLTISRSAGDVLRESLTLYMAGNIENWKGEYDKAVDLSAAGVRVAREHNLVAAFLRSLYAQALSLTGKGDYDTALALFNEGLALAEKIGDAAFIPRYLNGLGWLYIECEDLERGLDFNRRGADISRERSHGTSVEMTAFAEINMADVLLTKGDFGQAHDAFEGVHRVCRNPEGHEWMRWRYSAHLFVSLGQLWLARGDPTKALEFADRCLNIATPTESRKYISKAWRLRGEIALARHEWEEAERWLDKALKLARLVGNPPQLWRTHLAMGRLHDEAKRADKALREYRAARAVVDRIKSNAQDSSLCTSLKNSPRLQQVYELAADA